MECISFPSDPRSFKCKLNILINNLNQKSKSNNPKIRHRSTLELFLIFKCIDYASDPSWQEFDDLISDPSKIIHSPFALEDPITGENIRLVKKIIGKYRHNSNLIRKGTNFRNSV